MSRILVLAAAAALIATPAMALSVQAMPKNADGSARFAAPANPFANAMPQVTYGSGPWPTARSTSATALFPAAMAIHSLAAQFPLRRVKATAPCNSRASIRAIATVFKSTASG